MATAVLSSHGTGAEPTLRERVVDTARRMAHLSHEARMVTSMAGDAVDEQVYRARRLATQARRGLDDTRDDMVHGIKQEPLMAVGVAFGTGLLLGVATSALAWMAVRRTRT